MSRRIGGLYGYNQYGFGHPLQEGGDRVSNGMTHMEAQKRAVGEMLWLHYYNQVLFERGVISEDERNRMINRIDARAGNNFH